LVLALLQQELSEDPHDFLATFRRVCQNIILVAVDMRREWLDRENYAFGAV